MTSMQMMSENVTIQGEKCIVVIEMQIRVKMCPFGVKSAVLSLKCRYE